jgi:hypothetical protein
LSISSATANEDGGDDDDDDDDDDNVGGGEYMLMPLLEVGAAIGLPLPNGLYEDFMLLPFDPPPNASMYEDPPVPMRLMASAVSDAAMGDLYSSSDDDDEEGGAYSDEPIAVGLPVPKGLYDAFIGEVPPPDNACRYDPPLVLLLVTSPSSSSSSKAGEMILSTTDAATCATSADSNDDDGGGLYNALNDDDEPGAMGLPVPNGLYEDFPGDPLPPKACKYDAPPPLGCVCVGPSNDCDDDAVDGGTGGAVDDSTGGGFVVVVDEDPTGGAYRLSRPDVAIGFPVPNGL